MKVPQAARTYIFKSALTLLGLLALGPQRLSAQQQTATCTDWTNIASWSGTITVTGSGTSTDGANTFTTSVQANISFTATAPNGGPGSCVAGSFPTWPATGPQVISSVTVHDVENTTCNSNNVTQPAVWNFDVTNGPTDQSDFVTFEMDFSNPNAPFYFFYLPQHVDGLVFSGRGCAPFSIPESAYPWGPTYPSSVFPPSTSAALPGKVSPLVGGATFQTFDGATGGVATWTVSWNIVPDLDLAVAVTIPSYQSWRPTAGRTETDLGEVLQIEAELRQKSTNQPALLTVPDKWSFNLVDVSREPGVAMNWPAKDKAQVTPDMAFDSALNLQIDPNLTFSPQATIADINNPSLEPNPYHVQVLLAPHDWGGWATLNVTAVVNGVSIRGYLELQPPLVSDPSQPNILLPRRQPGSFIADVWKENHGVPAGTPDNDDSESKPQGDGQPGDGLTLYEEYRGFYMGRFCKTFGPQPEGTPGANCVHVEGDPNTKDFFVVNQIGAEGVEGIGLFQFASGLNVHYRGLTLSEIGKMDPNDSTANRAINFNHSVGPHVVNEHAVILRWAQKSRGGISVTIPTADAQPGACAFLPKHTDHIEMDPILKNPEYVSANQSGYGLIDTDVAHELSHSVEVCHHGDGVDHWEFWTLGPNNTVMTQRLGDLNLLVSLPAPIVVDPENHNPPTDPTSDRMLFLLALDLADDGNPTKPDGTPLVGRRVRVGNCISSGQVIATGGESSGDVLDIMRYHNTEAYIPAGFPDSRIWVEDIPLGVDLTDHPVGTGVNNPNRTPRSRYGDTNPNAPYLRGNDRSQVDVNDVASNTDTKRANFVCQP